MTEKQNPNQLHTQLSHMIALEAAIEQNLEELIPAVSAHTGATTLLTTYITMCQKQQEGLETRLRTIAGDVPISKGISTVLPVARISPEAGNLVSTALQIVYTMFHQAVIGYAVLHSLSTRFNDGPYTANEGTSYHLTRQHTENYIQAIQQISRLIHDVVLWELDEGGFECQCACISCRSGICLCAQAGKAFLSKTWAAAEPLAADRAVYVQPPKRNSPAAEAGLLKGDVIVGANGDEFNSFWDTFDILENTKSGEEIHWMVRRDSDGVEEVSMGMI